MSRGALTLVAGLVALLAGLGALVARGAPPVAADGAARPVVDAGTAWRLRRIALSLATPRLEQVDSALTFPSPHDALELPGHDELWALAARVVTAGAVGAPGEPVDLALLERLALFQGPALALVLLLGLLVSVRQLSGGGEGGALLGTLVALGGPCFLALATPGVVRIELTAAVVLLVALRLLVAALTARSSLDRFTEAMIAGGAMGVGLCLSPLFLLPAAAAAVTFLRAAGRAPEGEREDLGRAFLLFWITTILGGLLPAMGGPWLPAAEGLVRGWTRLVSELALLGVAPFLLLRLAPRRFAPWLTGPAGALWPLGLLAIGGTLLALAGPDHSRTAVLAHALGLAAEGPVELPSAHELVGIGLVAVGCLGLRNAAPGPERDLLAALSVLALGAALVQPLALLLAALPAGLGVAETWRTSRARAGALAGATLALAIVWGASGLGAPDPGALEVVRASRLLRGSLGPGPGWESPRPVQRGAVLCAPEVAPLVVWHARRACVTGGLAHNGDPRGRARLEELLALGDPGRALQAARERRIDLVLLGPGQAEGRGTQVLQELSAGGALLPAGAGDGEARFLQLLSLP